MKNNKISAFTLVELIVVITILAVLATVAFISFQGYTSSSRDSVRLADLKNISKSFEINRTKGIDFPLPDKKVDISSSGTIFQYQWELSQNILNSDLNIFDWWVDPLTWDNYWYAVNSARNKFQIIWFLENQDSVANISMNPTFADNSDKYVKSSWDSLGILLNETTNEIIVQSGSLNTIEIQTDNNAYNIVVENNINTIDEWYLKNKLWFRTNPKTSCYSILKNGDSTGNGMYTINPTGEREFEMYCDMSWWWWTHFNSNFSYNYSASQECINEKLFSDNEKQKIEELLSVALDIKIETDLYTKIQADDSINNSTIFSSLISNWDSYNIFVWAWGDNTQLIIQNDKKKILCTSHQLSHRCWYTNKPSLNQKTPELVLFGFDYQPTCNNSSAYQDGWHRNKFTLTGTYYNISIK